jgi:nucleoside-diphosphate-sugar epimerase
MTVSRRADPMKRLLITGASGFVGSHCLAPLLARGYEVHAVSTGPHAPAGAPSEVRWHQADLLDPRQAVGLVRRVRPTHLLHLAWVVAPGTYRTSPLNWQWANASLTMLEAFAAHGGRRAVMGGSCAEYGSPPGVCVEHETPLCPRTLYGASKSALSLMLPVLARQVGVESAAWARMFYLYGPGEHPSRLVPSVIRALSQGEPMPCTHGEQVRDFLYVADAADALAAVLDSSVAGPVNVASGQPISLRTLLSSIGAQLGRPELLRFGERSAPPDEPPRLVADVTRLARDVGWTPGVSLEDGLRRTIAWWRSQPGRCPADEG